MHDYLTLREMAQRVGVTARALRPAIWSGPLRAAMACLSQQRRGARRCGLRGTGKTRARDRRRQTRARRRGGGAPVIQRIVLFQVQPETPDAEIAACVALMRALPAQIPEIRHYAVAYNRKGRGERYYVSLIVRFADDAALERYEGHPANKALVRRLLQSIGATAIFDAEMDPATTTGEAAE
jgi:hypothetical protein